MNAIVSCLKRLVDGGVVKASTTDDLLPYLKAIEKHYNAGKERVPAGWADVALDTATTAYIATRNKDVFVSTYYSLIDAYAEHCK